MKLVPFAFGIFVVELVKVFIGLCSLPLCLFRTQLLLSFSEVSNVTEASLDQLRLLGSQLQDIKHKLDLLAESKSGSAKREQIQLPSDIPCRASAGCTE